MRGKTEPFERACGARVAQPATRTKEFLEREFEPFVLLTFGRRDAVDGRMAIDAASNEFRDEPRIADGLRSAVDEEPREETVVDEPVGFRSLDGRTYFIFGITAPCETRP